ncbi:MAG: tetratricopeptide repeat protein, partial [Bacteroidota bacterium]
MKHFHCFLLLFICTVTLWAQPCNIQNGLQDIASLNYHGDYEEALEKAIDYQSCVTITNDEAIALWTWRSRLNRSLRKERRSNRALLEAKKLLEARGEPLSFDFRMLLAESSALRKDTVYYNQLLADLKKEIFERVPEDHLSKGRYYFLINYEGNDLVPNLLKAVQHFEQLDSTPTMHLGIALRVLGNKHRDLGDPDKSEGFYKRELEVYTERYPEEHFNRSICNFNLGNVYYDKLEYQLALDRYLKVVPVWEKRYDPDHFRMRTLNEAFGDMYWELGDQSNALSYFDKATLKEVAINNDQSETTIANADSLL